MANGAACGPRKPTIAHSSCGPNPLSCRLRLTACRSVTSAATSAGSVRTTSHV